MRLLVVASLLVSGIGQLSGCDRTKQADKFMDLAASEAQFEIEASKVALAKAANQDVKAFAQQVRAYHEAAADKLGQAAIASGRMPPQAGLRETHASKLKDLKLAEGAEFDQLFVEQQLAAYSSAVELFSKYAADGDGGPIQAFAQEAIPRLEAHLSHVRGLKASPLTSFIEVPVSNLEPKTPCNLRLGASSPYLSTASSSS